MSGNWSVNEKEFNVKNLFIVLVLFLPYQVFAQQWKEYSRNAEGDVFYIDIASIKNTDKLKRVWRLSNFKEPLVSNNISAFSSVVYTEIDCKEQKYRNIDSRFFDKPNGSGKVVEMTKSDGSWSFFAPGSTIYSLYQVTCK